MFLSAKGRPTRSRDNSDAQKADYLFLESQKYKALEDYASYYELIEAAYENNPADPYLGKEYAMRLILTAGDDSLQIVRGLDLIENYFKQNSDDLNTAAVYASVLQQVGRTDDAVNVWRRLYDASDDKSVSGPVYANLLSQTFKEDSIRKAVKIIEDVEASEGGSNVNTTIRKMQYYLQVGDTSAVIDEAKALLASQPNSIDYTSLLGNIYLQLNQPDSALIMFNRAVELDPTSGMAYYNRANYYQTTGDSLAYDREIFTALMLPDLDLEPKLGLLHDYVTNLYSDSTQWDKIDDLFETLIDQYPHEASVRLLYTDYLTSTQRYAPAAEQLSFALASDPDDEKRWEMLGSLYLELEEYDKVVETADQALRYFPEDITLYQLASVASLENGGGELGLSYLDRALAITDPDDNVQMAQLIGAKGDYYYKEEQPDSAFVYYNQALKYNPEDAMLLNNAAYYLACEDKDLDRALELIEKSISISPENVNSLDTYAWVLFKRKDYAKAKEQIDAVLELPDGGDNFETLEHAGDIYFMNGEPNQALEFWQMALKLDPDNELLQKKVRHKTFFFE